MIQSSVPLCENQGTFSKHKKRLCDVIKKVVKVWFGCCLGLFFSKPLYKRPVEFLVILE